MLDDLTVIDFSQNLPGPYATFMLASWGAEVIKVEPPRGDPGRFVRPFFSMINRGKKSVVLDLREEDDRDALVTLVREADVLVEGFRPGVMARLGFDYQRCRALNPRLVYCSISAFGQAGPLRDLPGHDLNLQAMGGVAHLERGRDEVPRGAALPIADLSTSLAATTGILGALYAREKSGEGTHLDIAMADTAFSFANVWGVGVDFTRGLGAAGRVLGGLRRQLDREKLYAMPQYGIYRCRGGGYLSLGIVDERHFLSDLFDALGLRHLGALKLPQLLAGGRALRPLVAARLRTRTIERWMEEFSARGIPAWPVRTPAEASNEPQAKARELFDASGWMRAPLPGARHLGEAPELGEHTDEVLAETRS